MRKAAIFVFMVLFQANTAIVSAWVQPCKHDMSASVSPAGMAFQDQSLPCHHEEKARQSGNRSQHCDGLCLCAHVSSSPSLFMKNGDGIELAVITKQLFVIDNSELASDIRIPPKPPPRA